jgi:DNA-binding NarL/FixJ family response regulator
VDDQEVVRKGIIEPLRREKDLAVCGEADDVIPALAGIGETKPDLALIDMHLGVSSGIDLIRELRKVHPKLPVVGMTAMAPSRYERQARAAGANGFASKDAGVDGIIAAIRGALESGS